MTTPSLPVRRSAAARNGVQPGALTPGELLPAMLREARRHQLVIASIFAAIGAILSVAKRRVVSRIISAASPKAKSKSGIMDMAASSPGALIAPVLAAQVNQ